MTHSFHNEVSDRRIAIFPGSFDPFTVGHMSILKRGLELFDKVIVAIGYNEHKYSADDMQSRKALVEAAIGALERVEVMTYDGLTVDAAKRCGARFILRGIRNVADFEYERNMADINRQISGIETVLLYSLPELSMISSSMVRELKRYGYDTSGYEAAGGE